MKYKERISRNVLVRGCSLPPAIDPMMGTGEVLRVAKRLNREFIGIDKDAYSVEIAKGMMI